MTDTQPIGWVFQHNETGRMSFCPNDGVNTPAIFARLNPRHALCGPAFTTPPPQPRGEGMVPNEKEQVVTLSNWLHNERPEAERVLWAGDLVRIVRLLAAAPGEGSGESHWHECPLCHAWSKATPPPASQSAPSDGGGELAELARKMQMVADIGIPVKAECVGRWAQEIRRLAAPAPEQR